MLRLCVVLFVVCNVRGSEKDTWPFKVADRYMEEFKSNVNELRNAALDYKVSQTQERTLLKQQAVVADEEPIHYDFIIVGGGTSGSVLASRLSEVPEWKILLLEAGGVENKATRVPKNWEVLRNTPYNWGFTTTPQNYTCLGMEDHQCTIPSGRALGGSSTINSMIYTRGNPRDYDVWADMDNKGWCWASVLPFFKKIEDANFAPFDKKFHRRGGAQHIQHPQHYTLLAEHALEAAKELDMHVVDYNGKHQIGASIPQLTTNCGERYSTATSYLEPVVKRENLIIKPLSQVLKVIISPHAKEAKGVQYLHGGKIYTAKVKKEVILSAGAVNTPKILMLSGVGPKEECEKHEIESIVDLPVGRNLNIRPSFIGLDFLYKDQHQEPVDENDVMLKYLKDGKGPLTAPGTEAVVFIKTNVTKEPGSYPDLELQFVSKSNPKFEDYSWMRLTQKSYDSIWKPLEGKDFVKLVVTLNHPHSKGVVKLHGPDPLQDPLIEPHFLADEDEIDFHTMLAGIEKAIQLSHTESFLKLGLTINDHPIHGCEGTEFGSEAYWSCAIKYLVVPTEDVSGTARMGPSTDDEAVVDNKLNVHGVHYLRVADASVIPVSITGNLMAANIMIGEQAAHLLLEEWEEH